MEQTKIYVYAGWENNKKIGTIYSDILNGSEIISFEYENEWLREHPNLMLDPNIPLTPYRSYSPDKILFGAFQDSCPDRWGRTLIDRRESTMAISEHRRPRKFFETGYLLGLQDICRSGGFRFKTDENGAFLGDEDKAIPPISSIRELEQISLGYEKGQDNRWIHQLVNPGSSLGGARPKANIRDIDGTLWIAKFPSKNDSYDVGAWEKTVHDMEKMCNIPVPESNLHRYSDYGSTFFVKRFDRTYQNGKEERIHFASAMTMLGMRDGKTDGVGYLDLVDIISRLSKQPNKDLEQLFRRVIFDISVSNQDNHLRNHGFLLSNNQWTLSPSYDMNPVHNADYLSLYIDLDDGYRSLDKALQTASFYHLTSEQGVNIIKEITSIVAESWRSLATKNGISESEKNLMSSSFELAERETFNNSAVLKT